MDEVIFQEFKGTGNMELILDRAIADRRIFPAVDVLKSGTRREELLCSPEELAKRHLLRRALADLSPVEAAQFLIDKIQKTPSNAAFLSTLVAPAPAAARRFRSLGFESRPRTIARLDAMVFLCAGCGPIAASHAVRLRGEPKVSLHFTAEAAQRPPMALAALGPLITLAGGADDVVLPPHGRPPVTAPIP